MHILKMQLFSRTASVFTKLRQSEKFPILSIEKRIKIGLKILAQLPSPTLFTFTQRRAHPDLMN